MDDLMRRVLSESLIDFARPGLSPHVWTFENGEYHLSSSASKKILSVLEQVPKNFILGTAAEMHIVGSITTNLYADDTDVDLHIVPRNPDEWSEDDVDTVRVWFEQNRDSIGGYIGTHPLEVYIQTNPNQDLLSEGAYDVKTHKWLKGPKVFSEGYNPYEDFTDIADEIRSSAEDADLLLGELKRDVIDYDTIRAALSKMSPDQRKKFLTTLQGKLEEIEQDIEKLVSMKKEWVSTRKSSSQPTTPEQALEDIEMAKKWRDSNAIFKFLTRYRYLKVIKDLGELIKGDDDLEADDVITIKRIIGSDLCQS